MEKILIITMGGIGDCLLGVQTAIAIKQKFAATGLFDIEVMACVRDEVFAPLAQVVNGEVKLMQHPDKEKWGNDYWILHNQEELKQYPHQTFYVVCPDLLFRAGNLSFDFNRFGFSLQQIKENRALTRFRREPRGLIYVATNTSTPQYFYDKTPELVRELAVKMPNKTIYFNDLTKWAGHSLNNGKFEDLPNNVQYEVDGDFSLSLELFRYADYCVSVDNAFSHISHQMGIPRTVISNRLNLNGLMWVSRWYENLGDCIGYEYSLTQIAELVKTNVEIPQTALIPRTVVIDNPGVDWGKILGFKF